MKAVVTLALSVFAAIALLLALPYLLPLAGPFLIAFAAAAAMEPAVGGLCGRGVPRGLAAGVVTVLLLTVLGILLSLTVSNGVSALMSFAKRTPELLSALSDGLSELQQRLLGLIHKAPEGVTEQLTVALDALAQELYAVPAWLSEKLLSVLAGAAKRSPDLLLFTATTAIGVYFFSAYYRDIMDFIQRQLPPKLRKKARHAWAGLRAACGGYLRVQLMLVGVTFAELWVLFLLMRQPRPLLLAAAVALVDALPVLGAGTVLLPWAVYDLIIGRAAQAIWLLLGYAVISAVRNMIQAKLMGDQLGLHPVVSLVCIYVGWRLAGFAGMLILPIAAVVVQHLNDARARCARFWGFIQRLSGVRHPVSVGSGTRQARGHTRGDGRDQLSFLWKGETVPFLRKGKKWCHESPSRSPQMDNPQIVQMLHHNSRDREDQHPGKPRQPPADVNAD